MKYPDAVTLLKPRGPDEYGNPGRSWDSPTSTQTVGFLAKPTELLLPPDADLVTGDRVRVGTRTYEATVTPARSPARTVLLIATLVEIGG